MDRADLETWRARDVARLLALVDNERRYYQEIVAAAPVALAVVASGGELVSANRAFKHLFSSWSGDPQHNAVSDLISKTEVANAIDLATTHGTATDDLPVVTEARTLRASVQPIRTWSGDREYDALLVLKESRPIGAGQGSETAGVPAVVWTVDAETHQFLSVAGACEELLGFPRDHWIEARNFWSERIAEVDRDSVMRFYGGTFSAAGPHSCEFRANTVTGKVVWCRETFRVVQDGSGSKPRLSGVTIGIDQRRRAEEDNIQAHRADAIIRLSRQLTHDFNNALMIVTGYAEELLAYFTGDDPRTSDVKAILSAAETMAGLTGELHGFTQKQSSPAVRTDLTGLLAQVASRIREDLGAVLVLRAPESPLTALAGAAQLEALLVAIARALRNSPDPHMIITAATLQLTEMANLPHALPPGNYIEIVFRGPLASGLPPDAFEHVLTGRRTHASELARAYAVIREWGGTIRTGTSEDATEIRVLLPHFTDPPPEVQPDPAPAPSAPLPEPEPVAGTVIVVEDERGIRALIRKVLDREGYRVFDTGDPEQALAIARENGCGIGLLITDLALPGSDGQDLARRLMADCPHMKVLYISGYTDDPEMLSRGTEAGSAFLQKPFTLSTLVKKVKEAFGHP